MTFTIVAIKLCVTIHAGTGAALYVKVLLRNRDRINFLGMARTDDVIPFAVELRVIDLDIGQVSFGDLDAGGVDVGAELATNLQSRGGGGVSD